MNNNNNNGLNRLSLVYDVKSYNDSMNNNNNNGLTVNV